MEIYYNENPIFTTTVIYFDTLVQYMVQLYQNIIQMRVLAHFIEYPTEEFYLRELGRILGMSPMTVKRSLDLLLNDGFIIREKRKNQILYQANMVKISFRFLKISHNLAMLEEKHVVDDLLDNVQGISSIVLYGSYARGENDAHSDIDILTISMAKKIDTDLISKNIDMAVNIMNFTSTQWTRQAKDNRPFYLDIITEGIVLYGTRPVIE